MTSFAHHVRLLGVEKHHRICSQVSAEKVNEAKSMHFIVSSADANLARRIEL
jgi:hypothetical protein